MLPIVSTGSMLLGRDDVGDHGDDDEDDHDHRRDQDDEDCHEEDDDDDDDALGNLCSPL